MLRGPKREVRDGEALLPMTSRVPRMHNVIWHNDNENPEEHEDRIAIAGETMPSHPDHWDLPSNVVLHTSQSHFGSGGIRRYMSNPEAPSQGSEGRHEYGEDLPEVYSHGGKYWIYEGHHRIIASRLRGEGSIPVHVWNTGE